MECIKNCCKNFMKKTGKEQEAQGKQTCCKAACCIRQVYQRILFLTVCLSLVSSDHTEDASQQCWIATVGWREEVGHRRLPPFQAAPRWQGGTICPAHLQGLLHSTQRLTVPKFTVWAAEYVPFFMIIIDLLLFFFFNSLGICKRTVVKSKNCLWWIKIWAGK